MGVITALGTVMMPRMSNIIAKGDKKNTKEYIRVSIKVVTCLGAALAFGIIGTSKVLAPVYFGKEFEKCSSILMLLSITIFSLSWANVCRTQYLIPSKKDKVYVNSTIVGAVINLLINLLLIPKFGANGAAVGTIFAEMSLMVIQVIYVNKTIPVVKYIFDSTHYIISGILMMITVYIVGLKLGTTIISLVTQIFVGGLTYTIITLVLMKVLNDDMLPLIKSSIKIKKAK